MKTIKDYSPILIRYGLGIVFFLFGIDQIVRPEFWYAYFPDYITSFGFTLESFAIFNGVFDLIVGVFLLAGLFTRVFSLIAALHLVGVIYTLGYSDIAIRDFGLLLGSIAILLYGSDKFSLDRLFWKKKTLL